MAKEIRVIEAKKRDVVALKRVAAYARVSTDTERLMHSLSAQISYYSELIQKTPGWQYAGVYADEGITGTKMSARAEFQRMLADCEAGKIDIILTKSISRFARNTVDTLSTVRHLKSLGIEVRFEKERISSMGEDGELLITLLASFAQEEVRSLSDNVRWAIHKRFQQGLPNSHFRVYGYNWEGEQLVINPEEAAVVRRIYQNFLDGKSRLETERELNAEGITTKGGCRWADSNIKLILTNVIYTGNMLFMKEYVADPITKKRRKNHGEVEQYYVENTHEPIIDMETFQYVQSEMARRQELGAKANKSLNLTCFSSIMRCGRCGQPYVHNTRNNKIGGITTYGDKIELWRCLSTTKRGSNCNMKIIPDRVLRSVSAEALGLEEFDETVLTERVEHIDVLEGQLLRYIFKDGTEKTLKWKSTAKHDCWTAELKNQQRIWMQNYMSSSEEFSEFTTRIRCGICGSNYRRYTLRRKDHVLRYWRCGANSSCGRKGLREDLLQKISAEVMGLPAHDPVAFREQIEYIEVMSEIEVAYHFKDGRIVFHDWPKGRQAVDEPAKEVRRNKK